MGACYYVAITEMAIALSDAFTQEARTRVSSCKFLVEKLFFVDQSRVE